MQLTDMEEYIIVVYYFVDPSMLFYFMLTNKCQRFVVSYGEDLIGLLVQGMNPEAICKVCMCDVSMHVMWFCVRS